MPFNEEVDRNFLDSLSLIPMYVGTAGLCDNSVTDSGIGKPGKPSPLLSRAPACQDTAITRACLDTTDKPNYCPVCFGLEQIARGLAEMKGMKGMGRGLSE